MSRQTGGLVEDNAGGDTEPSVRAGTSAQGSQAATATRIDATASAPRTAKANPEPLKIKVKVKVDTEVAFPDGVKISLAFETDLETVLLALLTVEVARRCSGSITGPSST